MAQLKLNSITLHLELVKFKKYNFLLPKKNLIMNKYTTINKHKTIKNN